MKSTYPIIGEFSLCRTKSHVVLFTGISSWFFIFSADSDFHHIRVLSCSACVYTIVQFWKRVHGKRNVTNLRITIVIIVLRNLRMRRGLFLAQINSHCSVAVTWWSFVGIWFDIVSLCDFLNKSVDTHCTEMEFGSNYVYTYTDSEEESVSDNEFEAGIDTWYCII